MSTSSLSTSSPYWYGDEDAAARELLEAVRVFRRSDEVMRQRASREMDMNVTDLRALRFVIAAQRRGEPVTPRGLAEYLEISTASTTKLLDRLSRTGRLQRQPHPHDRRSFVVLATEGAQEEVRERLTRVHREMFEVARQVPEHCRGAVRDFLLGLAAQVDEPEDAAAAAAAGGDEGATPGGLAARR
ncbi:MULTISPECIES: MarR family winged helix-turn-helix transcriptional regulator [unclassified Isoptericola]|uniref:MarR family winged helix-turn-helix transcriptional regulator n=1 Tax=unclassified Isoptericola TaxID=2623355 RepID=UPI0027133A54|nr:MULTISPECIES: MarR family transcriptional regulator [unclassified Isoptericola]MDO8143435.1 MarR family transcriptional regulator [Isoptericola sp. 178]MDO8147298.1 MarR family transcriptional regulator [Isoptericola sp. b515]MDO8150389.1 MarR family transcriptional regulator [Isoptericola sp. b408]